MAKRVLTCRVSEQADSYITNLATRLNVERAIVVRAMLSVASRHPEEIQARVEAEISPSAPGV